MTETSTNGWVASVETVPYEPLPQEEPVPEKILEPLLEAPSVAVVHQKIPAECFSQTYDCNADPTFMCCSYMR